MLMNSSTATSQKARDSTLGCRFVQKLLLIGWIFCSISATAQPLEGSSILNDTAMPDEITNNKGEIYYPYLLMKLTQEGENLEVAAFQKDINNQGACVEVADELNKANRAVPWFAPSFFSSRPVFWFCKQGQELHVVDW